MTKRRSSRTGSWSGAYRYAGDAYPETVFNAQIEERDGVFVGQIQEPNLEDPSLPSVFTAEIEGIRAELNLSFTKFYGAEAEFHMAIRYEGDANDALTHIDGAWTRPDWSGTFFMIRDELGEEEAVELEVEAPIEKRQ
jgi:hypothetical protein